MTEQPSSERSIFEAAIEKGSPEERAAYLDEVCGSNQGLRKDVEALLAAHDQLGSVPPVATVDVSRTSEAPGAVIGPYKLLQQIGEGGMGIVFMAAQTHPVQRKVALKLIKSGMDSRQVIARFEAERQALAMMDHANIARVLDAGATESGRPYFVMELVHGVPITKYCDDNHLTPRERLELFVPVCQAIQHAHQKGIIHRDIKPSNVMITLYDGKPVPKVIDFGVAKATEQKLTERSLFTQFGTMVGTLEYMSPEQAEMSALGVDTRSDIYSLGVLLYELLTGSTPLSHNRVREAAYAEILRMIREEEPQKPSTRLSDSGEALASISAQRHTEPAKLSKLMRGELDWIVMKTLEKDRGRRYETANAFAADVQRYLNDETVQACPPSVGYRFRKFARRNKRALATVTLLALAILVVAGTLGWALRNQEATAQELTRERIAHELAIQAEVNTTLQDAERWQQQEKWPEALSAVKQAEGLLTAGGSAELRERVRQLRKDLEMVLRLEEIPLLACQEFGKWWDWETADRAYRQAFADYGIDVLSLPVEEAAARIRAHRAVAVQLVVALDVWDSCQNPRAPAVRPALTTVAQSADPDPWRQQVRQAVLRRDRAALAALAATLELPRQPTASVLLLARALLRSGDLAQANEVLLQAQRRHPDDFWLNSYLAFTLSQLSSSRHEDAISFYRAALAVRPRSSGAHYILGHALSTSPGKLDEAIACQMKVIELDPKFTSAHISLSYALHEQGKLDEAIACCKTAIDIDPKFSAAYLNLGDFLSERGKPDEAIACYRKAVELVPKSAGAHAALGQALWQQGKLVEAVACDQKAIVYYRKAIELDPKNANTYVDLGIVLGKRGNQDEAIACYRKAIELDPKNANTYYNLGNRLINQKELAEAIVCFRQAIDLDPKRAAPYHGLGNILQDQHKLDEAIACHKKAVELDPKGGYVVLGLADVLRLQGNWDEAIACHKRAIELDPKLVGTDGALGLEILSETMRETALFRDKNAIELDPKDAGARVGVSNVLDDQKRLDEAITRYKRAIELDPKNLAAHNNLGNALRRQGKRGEALVSLDKAIMLNPGRDAPWHNRGLVYLDLKQDDKARADFAKAIELKPDHAQAWLVRHQIYVSRNQYEQAVADYSRAIDVKPDNAAAWYYRGLAHDYLKHVDQAFADYSQAIKLKPDYHLAFFARGRAYESLMQWDKAVADHSEAIKFKPDYPWAFSGRGRAYAGLQQWDKAIADYSEAIKLKPDFRGASNGLCRAYESLKQWDKVIAEKTRISELNSTFAPKSNSLAWLLANCPDPKFRNATRAVELAKKAVQLKATDRLGWQTLAWAQYRAGDSKSALAAMENVKVLGSQGDSREWFLLALAHWQLGNKDEARKWYDQAIVWMEKNQPTNEELRRFRAEAADRLGVKE